jgi:hypothetical protein
MRAIYGRRPPVRRPARPQADPVASADVPVQAWFAQDEISVRPGESTSLALSVENLGDHTETYTLLPTGLTAAWTTITRPNVTLFGGSRDVIEVVVRPPAIHTTSAGPTAAAVRVIPSHAVDDTVIAEATLDVGAFDDRRIAVLQPLQRARRRATYEFMVENHGNNLASCRLHLIDPSHRVDGSFDPPAVGVAPGSSSLVRLHLRAQRGYFRRADRQLDFDLEASQPEHEPALGHAALIQPPTIPGRLLWRALGVAAVVAALALAWVTVVRPEVRDAADRAVEDRLDASDPADPAAVPVGGTAGSTPGTVPSTTPVTVAPPVAEGVPLTTRIPASVGVGLRSPVSYTVPPGARFDVTDVVLQNPNGDLGAAILLRNAEPLYQWDLGAMTGPNEFQPRITPIPFAPGDAIVLDVRCDATGLPTSTACEIAVLVGGRSVPTG